MLDTNLQQPTLYTCWIHTCSLIAARVGALRHFCKFQPSCFISVFPRVLIISYLKLFCLSIQLSFMSLANSSGSFDPYWWVSPSSSICLNDTCGRLPYFLITYSSLVSFILFISWYLKQMNEFKEEKYLLSQPYTFQDNQAISCDFWLLYPTKQQKTIPEWGFFFIV